MTNFTPTDERIEALTDKNGPEHPVHGRCWQWLGNLHVRSNRARLVVNGKLWWTARYIWMKLNGEIPETARVLHKCDNPSCVNPEHLFLGTQADNVADMVAKGRNSKGEAGYHKLTSEEVRMIRALYKPRHKVRGALALARRFGVTRQTIQVVAKYASRKHDGLFHKPTRHKAGAT